MNAHNNLLKVIVTVAFGAILVVPTVVFGQAQLNYQPLVGIPGVSESQLNFNTYINQLYFLSISIAALLAVIKIIIGGVKWMLTDIVTSKSEAKNDIRSALVGLVLIVSAVLILETINPQLRNLNVLEGAPSFRIPEANTSSGTIEQQRLQQAQQVSGSETVVTPAPTGQESATPIISRSAPWFSEVSQNCTTGGGTRENPCIIADPNTLNTASQTGSQRLSAWRYEQRLITCPQGQQRVEAGFYRVGALGEVVPSQVTCQ